MCLYRFSPLLSSPRYSSSKVCPFLSLSLSLLSTLSSFPVSPEPPVNLVLSFASLRLASPSFASVRTRAGRLAYSVDLHADLIRVHAHSTPPSPLKQNSLGEKRNCVRERERESPSPSHPFPFLLSENDEKNKCRGSSTIRLCRNRRISPIERVNLERRRGFTLENSEIQAACLPSPVIPVRASFLPVSFSTSIPMSISDLPSESPPPSPRGSLARDRFVDERFEVLRHWGSDSSNELAIKRPRIQRR